MIDFITGRIVPSEFDEPELGIDAGPPVELRNRVYNDNVKIEHATKSKTWFEIHAVRAAGKAMTGSDGGSDQVMRLRVVNRSASGDYARQRTMLIQSRNDSGKACFFMKGVDIEMDNRGTVADHMTGLRISTTNLTGATLPTGSRALEIELLEQAAPSGFHRAIDIRHNDASSVTKPTGIVLRGASATNGFAFALDIQANGLAKDGAAAATSAVLKLVDDSQNADLATAVGGAATGVIKVVIGSTVGYIPMYASYTPA